MKLTKVLLTGVIAAALMSTSCSSDSNDDMNGMDSAHDTEHMNQSDEHPEGDATNDEHPSTDAEHPSDKDHADGVHESSDMVEHEEVKLTLLPPAITETLKGEDYLDCKVERAFLIEENDVKTYEIRVSKGEDKATMLFNEKGIRLDK